MKNRIVYRNLPQLFLKARECLMSHFRPILNHYGLTEQQWRILRLLDEHGQLEPWELCEMCQMLSASMAGVLARMEELGLIHRARSTEDQRRVLVRLAEKGDQLISEIAPLIDLQYQYTEQAFGKQVFNDLFKALEQFIDANRKPVEHVELKPRSSIALERSAAARRRKLETE
ncbi:homoprotocatechuate degradation operon regulator HpaR [Noviherbaspirillum agri]